MHRIQSCSFKQGHWINNWYLRKRTDFISKTVYSLVWSSAQKSIKYESFRVETNFVSITACIFSWTLNPKQARSAGSEVWCARAKSIFSRCLTLIFIMLFRASIYTTQFLLSVWSSWMLESYFQRSRACKIQNFPRCTNHGGALGSH